MELVKLLLIRLKIILQYRALVLVTLLHLIISIVYVSNYVPLEKIKSENYIKEVSLSDDLYTYKTKDAIIYSKAKYQLGSYISYSGNCLDNEQRNFVDFEYSNYLISSGIKCSLYEPKIKVYNKSSFYIKAKNKVRNTILKNDTMNYKRAIVFGDKSQIESKEIFYNLHLSHILALSGMHITLVMLLMRFVFLKLISIKEYVDIGVVIAISMYCILIDYSYSVVRSFLLYYLIIFFNHFGIKLSKVTIFCLVLNLVLMYNRHAIFSFSFIYSFLCYLIILLAVESKYSFIKICFVIVLFTIPITINLSNQINILGLVISPIVTMLFELLYFPYLLLTTIFTVPDLFTKYFVAILEALYTNKLTFIIKDINILYVIAYYILVLYVIINKKRIKIIGILVCVCIMFLPIVFKKPYIRLTFFDVGQGDAMLIELDNGLTILIDGGGNILDAEKSDEIAKYIIVPYLKENGISSIDYIIASHGDVDHMGSFMYLINNYEYKNIYINCNEEDEIEKVLHAKKLTSLTLKSTNYEINFSCNVSSDENESSIVTYAKFFDTTFLSMGDMGYENEERYAIPADIFKISHHGSKTSTSTNVVEKVSPKYAIISVGKNNYGHPSKEVLQNLSGSEVYRTDMVGAIRITITDEVKIDTKLGR